MTKVEATVARQRDREPPDVAYDPDDLRCQNRTYAEDLGEGGAGSLHLLPDALLQRGDLPIEGANIAHQLGGQPLSGPSRCVIGTSAAQKLCGSLCRETLGATPSERRSRSRTCRRLRARVRSATIFSPLSVSSLRISTQPSSPSSGWTRASRSLRRAARAVKVASRRSFLRALPVESTLTREAACSEDAEVSDQ